ncbi:hypothetical protein PIB30_020767 [Stylosanthes scabra]|uniref:GH18 domain-containing protein n=1 Tax=Stylosanthes scabra TaxID=79078 RepID=A0ABU6Q8K4_9FABA|nr:hypothetical protein [Stylosanthes scabra]
MTYAEVITYLTYSHGKLEEVIFHVGFDDVDAVKNKVSYAKKKNLLGYAVWELCYDDNWVLSTAVAQQGLSDHDGGQYSGRLVIILIATVLCALLLGVMIYYFCKRLFESKGLKKVDIDAGDFHGSVPNIRVFSLSDIKLATKRFSIENKLGQGVLRDGKEIAVKMLAKTSTQGFEEFKNEITLTARLQHVNLVSLLGFYIDKEEHMLIYELMICGKKEDAWSLWILYLTTQAHHVKYLGVCR